MPTKHRDTIVSALRDGAMVDGLWVRTESCLDVDGSTWGVFVYVVIDDATEEGRIVWEAKPLYGPERDLDMMRHHMRGVGAHRAAAIIGARAGR
jgi:hypothetical protein